MSLACLVVTEFAVALPAAPDVPVVVPLVLVCVSTGTVVSTPE